MAQARALPAASVWLGAWIIVSVTTEPSVEPNPGRNALS